MSAASDRRGADQMRPPVELVLFDLGGVLADFRGPAVVQALTGAASEAEVWSQWLESPWIRRFDAGLCSADEFAAGAIAEWQLPYTPAEFLTAFGEWLVGPFEGAAALVERTHASVAVGCLSNMNRLHWEHGISRWVFAERFDPRFISFELGMVKPDAELFEYVIATIDPEPGNVLFIDDSPVNVARAAAHGFQAAEARGIEEAQRALVAHGVLSSRPQ